MQHGVDHDGCLVTPQPAGEVDVVIISESRRHVHPAPGDRAVDELSGSGSQILGTKPAKHTVEACLA